MKKSLAYNCTVAYFTKIRTIEFELKHTRRLREITKPWIEFAIQYEKDQKEITERKLEKELEDSERKVLGEEEVDLPRNLHEIPEICEQAGEKIAPLTIDMLLGYEVNQ
jgi:hypothetical protein